MTPWKPQHCPTLTDPREVGQLLRDIDIYEGGFVTKCAMRLSPLLFVRPGALRRAEWSEINLDAAEWRIPAAKMKGRVMHIVPLARQAGAILRELQSLTSRSSWVFPGIRSNGEPMSQNTINAALRRLGYDRTSLTAHGFVGMASTMLHERGWPSDVIERQLSHSERNAVKAAYNHAEAELATLGQTALQTRRAAFAQTSWTRTVFFDFAGDVFRALGAISCR